MIELNLTELFMAGMVIYGPIVLGIALLVGAAGIPIPGTFLIVAAGALVQQGILDLPSAFVLAVLGATTGDSLSYALGRFAKGRVQSRFRQSIAWKKAQTNFYHRGDLAVYLTCWLITPLAVPTNMISGLSGYSLKRFLAYDGAGEVTWVLIYGGVGYAFGSHWELISQYLTDFSGWLACIFMVGGVIYFLFRYQLISRFSTVRQLGGLVTLSRPATNNRVWLVTTPYQRKKTY